MESVHYTTALNADLSEFVATVTNMSHDEDLEQTLNAVLYRTRAAFRADAASILLVSGRTVTVAAATDDSCRQAADLQMICDEGPCLTTITQARSHFTTDLRTDSRWPVWGPRAAALGWASLICGRLALPPNHTFGALNLYSRQPAFFSEADLEAVERFAELARITFTHAKERQQLIQAMEARHFIKQAQSVLMQRYQIDSDTAFLVMRRASTRENRRLRDVAEDIATGGPAPAPPADGPASG